MTVHYIYCPNCKTQLERTTSSASRLGCPLRVCPHCQYTYLDKRYREPAVSGIPFMDKYACGWWFLAIFLVPPFTASYSMHDPSYFLHLLWLAPLILPIIIWRSIAAYRKRKPDLDSMMAKSVERLSDIEYAITLKKAKYKVPEMYLDPARAHEVKSLLDRLNTSVKTADKKKENAIVSNSVQNTPGKNKYPVLKTKNTIKLTISLVLSILMIVIALAGFLSMMDDRSDLPFFIVAVVLTAISVFVFISSLTQRSALARYNDYYNRLSSDPDHSVSNLVMHTDSTTERIIKDLEYMIKKGWIENAYIDKINNKVVFK